MEQKDFFDTVRSMEDIDLEDPKATQEKLILLMSYSVSFKDKNREFAADVSTWAKAMRQFFQLAWSARAEKTPKSPAVDGVAFPPFSEMLNPSNPASVPSCFRRIIDRHFTYCSNHAAEVLMRKCDFMFQFAMFFYELGALLPDKATYDAHDAFYMFIHRYKYYVINDWYRHPTARLRYMGWLKELATEFKRSFKPISEQLYQLEQGLRPVIAPSSYSRSNILDEREAQDIFMTLNDRKLEEEKRSGFGHEVTRKRAAELCNVSYNTIKNWEEKGPSGAAEGYPGRENLERFLNFAKIYRARVNLPPLEEVVRRLG